MPNITMTIDEKLLKKVRKIALEKNTSLTAIVRKHLEAVAAKKDYSKNEIIKKLKKSFNTSGVVIGNKNWDRDDLYER